MKRDPERRPSIDARRSKVQRQDLAPPPTPLPGFLDRLPRQLAAESLRAVTTAIATAHRRGRSVIVLCGAHVIKVGLSPVLIDLMRRGIVSAVASNGAILVHDSEMALFGHTSEDVEASLADGTFGMTRETHEFVNGAVNRGVAEGLGIGAAVGRALVEAEAPHLEHSLLGQAWLLGRPATAHVAIGTDIVHMRPGASGAALGQASFVDFRLLTAVVADLSGGVYLNAGSAVILPEVFLKAFTIAQNLGADLRDFTTVNIDMLAHYRPTVNVVQRPAAVGGGRGYALIGRHEILIPMLAFAVVDALGG